MTISSFPLVLVTARELGDVRPKTLGPGLRGDNVNQ